MPNCEAPPDRLAPTRHLARKGWFLVLPLSSFPGYLVPRARPEPRHVVLDAVKARHVGAAPFGSTSAKRLAPKC
jgi:hypothetical protein